MGDVFIEHLVKKKPSGRDKAAQTGIAAAFALVAFFGFFFFFYDLPIIMPLIILGSGYLAWHLTSFFNVEYEYVFTSGELDIDIIYSKRRRKRLFSAEIKNAEIMCHSENKDHEHTFSRADINHDYSSGDITPNTYTFYIAQDGKRQKITFEPNEPMLAAFKPYLGSKLKLNTNHNIRKE